MKFKPFSGVSCTNYEYVGYINYESWIRECYNRGQEPMVIQNQAEFDNMKANFNSWSNYHNWGKRQHKQSPMTNNIDTFILRFSFK